MSALAQPATANFTLLIIAGIVMVITLFLSKEARHVAQTELSLSSQNEEQERFNSTLISRGLVRMALIMNKWYTSYVPARIQQAIDKRFEPLPQEERTDASFVLDTGYRQPHLIGRTHLHRNVPEITPFHHLRRFYGIDGLLSRRPRLGARECSVPHYRSHDRHLGVVSHRIRRTAHIFGIHALSFL